MIEAIKKAIAYTFVIAVSVALGLALVALAFSMYKKKIGALKENAQPVKEKLSKLLGPTFEVKTHFEKNASFFPGELTTF